MKLNCLGESSHDATRRHLLQAAAEVFATVGFRAATVREICQRAGANIAAVNYHFGDKEGLYSAVLQESHAAAKSKYPADLGLGPNATPEQRLKAFVRSLLLRIFSDGPAANYGKMMMREMIEPTNALQTIVREAVEPMAHNLRDILRDILGPGAGPDLVRKCSLSVVSQVVYYHTCRPVVRMLYPDQEFEAEDLEVLADHITEFSLAGLREISRRHGRRNLKTHA